MRKVKRSSLCLGFFLAAGLAIPASASAAASLEDLWCTSASACVAVGASDFEEGEHSSSQIHVKRWSGSAWTAEELDPPDSAATSVLEGVACASTSACTAVGSYVDHESRVTLALALRWDGTDWDIDELSKPEAALSAELVDVACASASSCVAVGSYTDDEEIRKSLAMSWNGSAWSVLSVPIPSGAALSELEGISCTGASDCVAVGSFVNSGEVTKTLALSWNGSAWSIASTPEPSGSELNQLYDVACRPSDACTAVGTYFDSTGDQKTLALRRNTSKEWSIQTTPNKSNALSRTLTAVSCASTTSCVAMGMVEQGRQEIPIAIGWNGSAWSEQSIDTEALGAAVVKPESVFCTSSTNCDAVGEVSYGRSAAPRNLAFHFNGSVWVVSEAGGYERKWTSHDTIDRTSDLTAVSCPVTQRCFAVGHALVDGTQHSQVASWVGGTWSPEPGPEPEGAKTTDLVGVSCVSTSSCWAVGAYFDAENVQIPMAVRWNGTAWSVHTVPSPSGIQAGTLLAVDCASASSCTAVGTYVDAEDVQRPLAMSFDGTAWSVATVALPSGSVGAALSGVSCASATACMAVGVRFDAFGHEAGFAAKREGSSWTHVSPPGLEEEAPHLLLDVSCVTAAQCVSVGRLEDPGGDPQNLALDWDGTGWEEMEVPSGETAGLASISCASSTHCMAVGGRDGDSAQPPQILGWDGNDWEPEPPAQYPQGTTGYSLTGIACVSADECHATGSASHDGFAPTNAALALYDQQWLAADATAVGSGLRGVFCHSAENCLAVGDSVDQAASDPATSWAWSDEGWEIADASSATGAFLAEVSCIEPDHCTAVGRKGAWPFRPLAERWDGEKWSTQVTPAPAGRSSQLESISCFSASWCAAAGFSWPSHGSGAAAPLVQTWNGSAWQTASISLPGGAISAFLHDISCASASSCAAVGSYVDSAGVHHGLIERWNGSSWSATPSSPPGGQSYRLKGVDCTSSSACTAVGTSTTTAGGSVTAIALRWNGSSWAPETVPVPENVIATKLNDVDCYSSIHCVAAGSFTDAHGSNPFIVGRTSGVWTQEAAPEITSSGNASVDSISCPSAADCLAAGLSQSAGRPGEPFTVQTEGEASWERTEPVNAPSEPPPALTADQLADAVALLEADPAVQAAIGSEEYDLKMGSWTETEEEGVSYLVGAYAELTLKDGESWSERTWQVAAYETNGGSYEEGEYIQETFNASASGIETLSVSIDLVFDSEGNVIDGEAVEVSPQAHGPGEIEVDESEIEYDEEIEEY